MIELCPYCREIQKAEVLQDIEVYGTAGKLIEFECGNRQVWYGYEGD